MPDALDPRLCCAAGICCQAGSTEQANAMAYLLCKEGGMGPKEADQLAKYFGEAGLVLFPASVAEALRAVLPKRV